MVVLSEMLSIDGGVMIHEQGYVNRAYALYIITVRTGKLHARVLCQMLIYLALDRGGWECGAKMQLGCAGLKLIAAQ